MSLLERILTAKRAEVAHLQVPPVDELPVRRPVELRGDGELHLIAEIKRRSPSAGALSTKLGVGERARAYELGGASMVSVLCDSAFFSGSFEHLRQARGACGLPILCKEFVISELQLAVARASGADAALLIVRCLGPGQLNELIAAARFHDLVPLVEVTREDEVEIALHAGAQLVGVNARDLDTLEVDSARAQRVLNGLPEDVTRVHLSGLRSAADVSTVAAGRAHAALIGEALMRENDPVPLLRSMARAARRLGG